jgi:hypothetical protein
MAVLIELTLAFFFQYILSCSSQVSNNVTLEFLEEISNYGWEEDGAIAAYTIVDLPDFKPGDMANLDGVGIWYWHKPDSDPVVANIATKPETYQNTESIKLHLKYYAHFTTGTTKATVFPAICPTGGSCDQNKVLQNSLYDPLWSEATIEIDVDSLPV